MAGLLVSSSLKTWLSALAGGAFVGLVGVFPIAVIPDEESRNEKPYLEVMLSVAVGSQLADVFLHLLPEAFSRPHASSLAIGLWTLVGLFVFFVMERIFSSNPSRSADRPKQRPNRRKIKTIGYLNLLANFIDNLTHGAAIGGGFAVSPLIGVTTVAGIVIHEVPHEIGDFAILLQSGFDRWQATKAQLLTGLGGIVGASLALLYSNFVHSTSWVSPFTSGAFLYVALAKTVPDLLKHNDFAHSFRQLTGVFAGLFIIYFIVLYIG